MSGARVKSPALTIRRPTPEDASGMWQLVRDLDALEENSLYAYLILCRDFAPGCRVAEEDGNIVGLVVGYRPPDRPDTYFVWQVGVHPAARQRGLGGRMIADVLDDPRDPPRFLEANVAMDNGPSGRLFEGIARRRSAPCAVGEGFPAVLFLPREHATERLFRIGPIPPRGASPAGGTGPDRPRPEDPKP